MGTLNNIIAARSGLILSGVFLAAGLAAILPSRTANAEASMSLNVYTYGGFEVPPGVTVVNPPALGVGVAASAEEQGLLVDSTGPISQNFSIINPYSAGDADTIFFVVSNFNFQNYPVFDPSTEGDLWSFHISIVNDDNGNEEFSASQVMGCGTFYTFNGCASFGDDIQAFISVPSDATTDYTTTITATAEAYSPIPEPASFSLLVGLLLIIFGADAAAKYARRLGDHPRPCV
jgi:hypothetical protein